MSEIVIQVLPNKFNQEFKVKSKQSGNILFAIMMPLEGVGH